MDEILADDRVVRSGDAAAQDGDDLIIDLILTEVAEGLDDGAADAPGRSHVAGGGVLENDFPLPDLHLAGGTIGQEDDAGGNLIRESEYIGGVVPGWLDADGVPGDQRTGNGVCGRGDCAEDRVGHGVVVKSTGKLADRIRGFEPAQAGINRCGAAEIPKVLRSEYPTLTVAIDPATDSKIDGLWSF